jgi:plasmid maintenance system antidote protein VapI
MSIQRKSISNSPIKVWLKEHGISQRQLAAALDLKPGTVNGKVNGWIAWQPRDLEILHSSFGLSSDFVLGLIPMSESGLLGVS